MAQAPAAFEDEFVAGLTELFEEKIPFNRVMGLKVSSVGPTRSSGRLVMHGDLVGHHAYNRLHGGVIGACMDAIGCMAVLAALGARHMDEPPAQRLARFARLGTIDLRIDYLRPAIAPQFDIPAQVVRLGSRVATTRMEFLAADGTPLALGTGVYVVS